jgi:hypothetical protein
VIGIRPTSLEPGDDTQQRLAALGAIGAAARALHRRGASTRPFTLGAHGSSQAAKDEKDLKDAEKLSDA